MIDIHTHILPNLDDGSQRIEESLEMAVIAYESGVDVLVCTPHAHQKRRFENYYSPQLMERFQWFRDVVRQERIPLTLLMGMEIFSDDDVGDMILDRKLISINHSGYYLIEFPFGESSDVIAEQLSQVFTAGGTPVIAHPERYYCVQEDPSLIYKWCSRGCLAQVNKGSFFGKFGKGALRTAVQLLEHDLVTCVATDAHSAYERNTYMGDIWDYLEDQFGEETAWRLTTSNPDRILKGKRIAFNGKDPG